MEGVRRLEPRDIASFLDLAGREGWVSDRWELEFLLEEFPRGCLAWRGTAGTLGYVTSVRYGKSGWIGNLLVCEEARRRGVGRALMEGAVAELLKSGVETVWLTASADGAGLYRKLGFVPIDGINRWGGKAAIKGSRKSDPLDLESLRAIDRVGWGDRRESLLWVTCGRGRLHTSSGGFICFQKWNSGTQIGPWSCLIGSQAEEFLDQVLTEGDDDFFLDVPEGNFAAGELLMRRGFAVRGRTLLMYLGNDPLYQPGSIYALASMGSMG